jgi:uncharacterized protein YciI
MWYLTLHRWVGDPEEAIKSSLDDHLSWLREQERAGKLLIAGPSPDRSVGIIVFGNMSTAYELDELCGQEPFIARGYRKYEAIPWDVHQLLGIEAIWT